MPLTAHESCSLLEREGLRIVASCWLFQFLE